jgi:hypothetical protein
VKLIIWQTSLCRQLSHSKSDLWRIFRGFQDNGVTTNESRKHFPGDIGYGRVGWNNQSGDTTRLSHGMAVLIGHTRRQGTPIKTRALTSEIVTLRNGTPHLTHGVLRGFAGFTGYDISEFLLVFPQKPNPSAKNITSSNRGRTRPSRKGGICYSDRMIDILFR